MDHSVSYRPFRTYNCFVPFVSGTGVFFIICVGYCLFPPHWHMLMFLLISILCFWLSKVLYDSSNIIVLFEQEGLRIIGEKNNRHQYFSWTALEFAYYSRNYKGHLFLVLSPRELSQGEVKAYTNRGANSLRLCVDSVVVIYIDTIQNTKPIKDVVSKKVAHRTGDSSQP